MASDLLLYYLVTVLSDFWKDLILVWIMKVKGPKNQTYFIEALYVVVNAWNASFWNTWEYSIPISSEKWCPLGVTGPPKDEINV